MRLAKLLIVTAAVVPVAYAATVRIVPTEAYGVDDYVLENESLRVTVTPRRGARVTDILDKRTGHHVTGGTGNYDGVAKELVHDDQLPGELMQATHAMEHCTDTEPAAAQLVARYAGQTLRTKGAEFIKTYRLVEGEPFLRVSYQIRTPMVGIDDIALRLHHTFTPGGKAGPEGVRPFIPIPAGPRAATWNKIYPQYTHGWSAAVRSQTKDGIVCLFDIAKAGRGFNWDVPSIEWFYRPVTLKPGLVWADEVLVVPTRGLAAIDYADARGVYQAEITAENVTVTVYPLATGELHVQPTLVAPDGESVALPSKAAMLKIGAPLRLVWKLDAAVPAGNATLRVTLKSDELEVSFRANPAGVSPFSVPPPQPGPVPLGTEPVQRIRIARPLDGPEIHGGQPVKSDDSGWTAVESARRPKKMADTTELHIRRISLDTGRAQYTAMYQRARKDGKTSWAPHNEGLSGLGLSDPTSANFYGGGFFGMEINGFRLRSAQPEMALVRGSGKAAIDARWDIPTATVTLRLTALGDDGALYGQIDLAPKTTINHVDLKFLAFPGGFHGERDRRFHTATNEYGHDTEVTLAPDAGWLLLTDHKLDPGTGAVALAFLPEQIQETKVAATSNYGVNVTVSCKPATRRLQFVLWSMYQTPNARALERIRAEYAPAIERLRAGPRLFTVGNTVAEPTPKPPGTNLRVLELATFAHGESRWDHWQFDEFERSEYLFTNKYGRPTRYEEFLRRMVESSRYAFRANMQFEYFLRDRKDIQVKTGYVNAFADELARLYDYDVVVVNDFPLELLDPYVRELEEYVRSGRALIFLGGYGAYGGMGKGYGSWKDCAATSLLPVTIERTPDFVQQTDYKKGLPGPWGPGRTRTCVFPDYRHTVGNGFQRFGPVLPITSTLDWIGRGAQVTPADEAHPAFAGIPLGQLAPDYHRVSIRGEAETLARIGRDPAVAAIQLGKGKIVALMFSDARRFWLWPHTTQFYSQLTDWAAGRSEGARVSRISIGDWGRAVGVELTNPTDTPITGELSVSETGAGLRRAVRHQRHVRVEAHSSRRVHLDFSDAPLFAPGSVHVAATWAGHTNRSTFLNPTSGAGPRIAIDAEHKRHVLRREAMAPRITVQGTPPAGSIVIAELVDRTGEVVRRSQMPVPVDNPEGIRLPLPAERLAFGVYGYRVALRDKKNTEYASAAVTVNVCRLVIPEYPIFWYGYGAHNDGDLDCYTTLGLFERLNEQGNAVFGVRGWGRHNVEEICDRALGLGIPLISYCFYSPAVRGDDPKYPLSPHHPSRLAALRQKGLEQAGFAKHPAVHWFYIDDEGTGFSETDYDKAEFKKQTGQTWPTKFNAVSDHYNVAKFHLHGGNNVWKSAFDGLREALPDRTHFFLQTVGNVAANGGWIWDNFRDSDINCIDLYPPAPSDVGQCCFYYNAMRCLGYRNGHPGWIMLGEYRETFEMMRGQWWLALGSGLESHSWYGANYGGGPHGIGTDRINRIAPYDRRAMRYGALLARWDKPRSKIAMYWSLASCARRGEEEGRKAIRVHGQAVGKACEATALDFYRHDVYPDVLTEAEILRDEHLRYDAIVLAGVTWDTQPVVDKLTQFARTRPLQLTQSSTISIPGAVPYAPDVLAQEALPGVRTADPAVFAEPLEAGGQRYLIVYNHQDKRADADVLVPAGWGAVVYDVFAHRRLTATPGNEGMNCLKMPLDGFDGVLLAFFAAEPPMVRAHAEGGRCGQDIDVALQAGPVSTEGVVPVTVNVTDPDGRDTAYGGPAAVIGGSSPYVIKTGVNDTPGKWTVNVKDLVTGKTATTAFRLSAAK